VLGVSIRGGSRLRRCCRSRTRAGARSPHAARRLAGESGASPRGQRGVGGVDQSKWARCAGSVRGVGIQHERREARSRRPAGTLRRAALVRAAFGTDPHHSSFMLFCLRRSPRRSRLGRRRCCRGCRAGPPARTSTSRPPLEYESADRVPAALAARLLVDLPPLADQYGLHLLVFLHGLALNASDPNSVNMRGCRASRARPGRGPGPRCPGRRSCEDVEALALLGDQVDVLESPLAMATAGRYRSS